MNHPFEGTGVAIVTPFNNDKSIDYYSLGNLIEHLISNGVNYLVLQGTTGESVTLSKDEKVALLDFVVNKTRQRVPVVLGLGGNNTYEIVKSFDLYNFANVDAILSVSPYYNKPTQEGIFQHYKTIADSSPVPLILYNVPGRTGSNIAASTTLRLANYSDNIVAVKEASGNFQQCMDIIKNKPSHFILISGDDAITLPLLAVGGLGVISVIANAFPKEFSALVDAMLIGDFPKANEIHYELLELYDLLMADGNPAGIKAALKIKGICEDYLRLPLVNVSESTFNKMQQAITKIHS